MAPKVSVVVAVYNPGENINALVESLDAQSLAPGDLEVIFVDDGSTDGSYQRLQGTVASRPGFSVTQIPNSGWPGRPRNIGTDLATGDYVFFADHDDELFPESLERMHAMAQVNHADIVFGKVVGSGRHTPFWLLAGRDIPVASVAKDDLVFSRTVHKLFRRAFLADKGIRFPEGRVRLEDHNFMAQALPVADVVSVLASYPCYRWIARRDGSNSSSGAVEFGSYWGYFEECLTIFEQRAGAGPENDAALLSAAERIFLPIRPRVHLGRSRKEQAEVLEPLGELVRRIMPARLDDRLPVLKRLRIQALRRDDRQSFDRLQEFAAAVQIEVRLREVALRGGLVNIDVQAQLTLDDGSPAVRRDSERLVMSVGNRLDRALSAQDRTLLGTDSGSVEVTVRHRSSGLEWPLERTQKASDVETEQEVRLGATCQATVDPASNYFGSELAEGIWDVLTRTRFLGEHRVSRLQVDAAAFDAVMADAAAADPASVADGLVGVTGTRSLRVYRTKNGTLALKITSNEPRVVPAAANDPRPRAIASRWDGDLLTLTVQGPKGAQFGRGALVAIRQRDGSTSTSTSTPTSTTTPTSKATPTEVRIQDGVARCALPEVEPGAILDFYVVEKSWKGTRTQDRLAFGSGEVAQQANWEIYSTVQGGFSAKRLRNS